MTQVVFDEKRETLGIKHAKVNQHNPLIDKNAEMTATRPVVQINPVRTPRMACMYPKALHKYTFKRISGVVPVFGRPAKSACPEILRIPPIFVTHKTDYATIIPL